MKPWALIVEEGRGGVDNDAGVVVVVGVVGAVMRMCMLSRITASTAVINATSGRGISSSMTRAARPPTLVFRSTCVCGLTPSVRASTATALAVAAVEAMVLMRESTCCLWVEAGSAKDIKDTNRCTTAARHAVGKSTSMVVPGREKWQRGEKGDGRGEGGGGGESGSGEVWVWVESGWKARGVGW